MNPCDCCERSSWASGCSNCILDEYETICSNGECFLNHEGSCLLGIAEKCKASPEYVDDSWQHDCSECVSIVWEEGECKCLRHEGIVGACDAVCENFEERKE